MSIFKKKNQEHFNKLIYKGVTHFTCTYDIHILVKTNCYTIFCRKVDAKNVDICWISEHMHTNDHEYTNESYVVHVHG